MVVCLKINRICFIIAVYLLDYPVFSLECFVKRYLALSHLWFKFIDLYLFANKDKQGFLIKNEQPVQVYKIFNKIVLLSFILAV